MERNNDASIKNIENLIATKKNGLPPLFTFASPLKIKRKQ